MKNVVMDATFSDNECVSYLFTSLMSWHPSWSSGCQSSYPPISVNFSREDATCVVRLYMRQPRNVTNVWSMGSSKSAVLPVVCVIRTYSPSIGMRWSILPRLDTRDHYLTATAQKNDLLHCFQPWAPDTSLLLLLEDLHQCLLTFLA